MEEGREKSFTPEDVFCCEFAPYFMEGIKAVSYTHQMCIRDSSIIAGEEEYIPYPSRKKQSRQKSVKSLTE